MKNKKVLIFLAFGLVIMAIMLYFIGIDEVLAALAVSNLWFVLLAIIMQVFTYYLYTLRWQIINKTADMSFGILKLLSIVMISLAVNNLTPSGRGGGEPVRAYILSKESKYPFEDTFATVVADRTMDTFPFVILAIFTIIGIIFSFSLDSALIVFLVLCVVAILILVVILIYMCINEKFGVKITNFILKILRRFYKKNTIESEKRAVDAVFGFQRTMGALLKDKKVLYYALPLSFVIWLFEILRVYFVFLAFGANVNPILIGEVFILASLVGMIPLLPGGLGAVDGMMILLYSGAGITASISAAATVIERLISYWMTTIIGLLFLPFYGASVLDTSVDKITEVGSKMDELDESKLLDHSIYEMEGLDIDLEALNNFIQSKEESELPIGETEVSELNEEDSVDFELNEEDSADSELNEESDEEYEIVKE
ncbi:UPF0104 family protein [uncultured Methanobrevibacter sp.]|uniref:UPF0104 family protein n=1 Tax=uncultured Methanobrevibacter sp. TaxID=253161 RepID=UPI0026169E6C